MSYECYCDYEPWDAFVVQTIKAARKPHKCCECRREIKPGEPYRRTWGVYDGDVNTYKTCHLCTEMQEWARISVPCFCWFYEGLHESVREMVGEVRHDVPGFVMEWGRRAVAIRRAGGSVL